MTLEITITDTIDVTDLLGRVLNFAAKVLSWLKPADESADTPDVDDPEDNKSPPVIVRLADKSGMGESFGP